MKLDTVEGTLLGGIVEGTVEDGGSFLFLGAGGGPEMEVAVSVLGRTLALVLSFPLLTVTFTTSWFSRCCCWVFCPLTVLGSD